MLMPVARLSLIPMGVVGRTARAAVFGVLSQEFVGALGAKGLHRAACFAAQPGSGHGAAA